MCPKNFICFLICVPNIIRKCTLKSTTLPLIKRVYHINYNCVLNYKCTIEYMFVPYIKKIVSQNVCLCLKYILQNIL